MGWVEIAARRCCEGDAVSHDDALRDALAFHMPVATNTAAHLQLVFENVMRTSWLAGAVLSPDAASAQRAARELHDKLIRTTAAASTTLPAVWRVVSLSLRLRAATTARQGSVTSAA